MIVGGTTKNVEKEPFSTTFFANGQDRGKCFKRRGRLSKLIKKEQQKEVFVNSGGAVEMPGISRESTLNSLPN